MKVLQLLLFICITTARLCAQTNEKAEVEKAVEALRLTLINPSEKRLDGMVAEWLSYGHSSNEIENKKQFIASLLSGKFHFLSIQLNNQTIAINNGIAIVRHYFFASTHNKGLPPGQLQLGVLLVFQKIKGRWLLIARQAYKI